MFLAIMQIQSCEVSNSSPYMLTKSLQKSKIANSNCGGIYATAVPSVPAAYFHPAFCGANKIESFSNLIDKIGFGQIKYSAACDEIRKKLPDVLKQLNIKVGEGTKAKVFELNEKYVIKIKNEGTLKFNEIEILPNILIAKLKTWYGGSFIKIDGGKVSILKNANPEKKFTIAGVTDESMYYFKENVYNKNVKKLASLPQKAFTRVAKDLKLLNQQELVDDFGTKSYFSIDFKNPGNFMFSDDEIRIVDGINHVFKKDKNNVFALVQALIGRYLPNCKSEFSSALVKPRREILKKCFVANENAVLPLEEPPHSESAVRDILDLCGIKKEWPEIKSDISHIRLRYKNVENRSKAVEKYFNDIFNGKC